ncbi:hypothetical protein [Alicyclobacillus macrosporangiidus]|jgi:hypothetical protein|uniref:Uncharacterized protein n=1 Tax=Alicyclobacillus macrosporangiidus TaxID=392015 RepID=A0A1I7F6T5_9BACL|nr:hypothetical protein [Alicyclobacillus macrosporangiidus]SFU31855.1 hypothetical protein SAMN05421543_10189 [Alicyclobacillus macrosporangiidus]
MRRREHVLLGTDEVTLSVTAKTDLTRPRLFEFAVLALLARYEEEFGSDARKRLAQSLADADLSRPAWRLRPEDSCWNTSGPDSKA